MVKFTDGPAAGVCLVLARAPLFLRVTRDGKGTWDALDQLADKPNYDETLYAYRCTADRGSVHICRAGGKGGYTRIAEYAFIPEQPPEEVLRYNTRWQGWAREQHARETAGQGDVSLGENIQ